jgi:hypothetical protein
MKNLLRLEELAQFIVCLVALGVIEASWWAYLLLLLGPDIGMLGYLINARIGAITYNLLHHKGVAIGLIAGGWYLVASNLFASLFDGSPTHQYDLIILVGIILYGHASMDRIFGYGLKFGDNFHHTHLGWIGKGKVANGEAKVGQ